MDCADRVRFSLSDKSGILRFEEFEIVGSPVCAHVAEELKQLLLGQPLDEIDMDRVKSITCPGGGECVRTVIDVVEDTLETFARKR
jgi:hypothetical protein